ncbi:MAG: HlyD family type I secretion periplasmic adaptor subunit [marine bacterium B5-7]|nr:MAG: HlyD family type I secretion periplasmic adaptor subunit [marine bacterium B5-7]
MRNQNINVELEFLPAALEIQQTPPLFMSRYIVWAIMTFFTVGVIWSWVGHVDIVSVAMGKIVPSSRVKIIQPLETGVIREIYVKEGDVVNAGDILIELDPTLTDADQAQTKDQQRALKLDRARIQTILDKVGNQKQTDYFSELTDATPAQIKLQKDRISKQLNEYYSLLAALKDEKKQRQAERGAISERIIQLDSTIPLITERAKSIADLLKKDLIPRAQWLELEQERIEQVQERNVQKSNSSMVDSAIANINQRQSAQKAEFEKTLLIELTDVENRITAFTQEMVKADNRVTLRNLTSPVTGTVHQLAIHTIGGVVTPAQELMHIIPHDDPVEVEAWLPNKDIGFVQAGQEAAIKVETFPFTKYGLVDAEVLNVSNDATPHENMGLFYAMRVKMFQTTMQVKEKLINLSPGMAVTVEVNLGKRRLIEFLLSPLLRYKDESVRER